MIQSLRNAHFIDAARIERFSFALLALTVTTVLVLIVTASGGVDFLGRPLGTDFSNVWSAGRMTLAGEAAAAYDPALHYAEQQEIFNEAVPFYGWHYPPFFLIAAAALATLPYTTAWIAWMAATLPAYVLAISKIVSGRTAIVATLGFPAVTVNFLHGQNGFLTAALFGGALCVINRRAVLAGVLIGLLAYKPQFGVMIPIALVAGGYWRTIMAAALTVLALCGLSTLLFGFEIWSAFLESRHFTKSVVLETGGTGWEKIQSLFSAVRMWGGSIALAYAMQAALAVFLAVSLFRLWRSSADHDVKAAGLAAASLLATPYCLDYDLMALAPGLAFLTAAGLRRGFPPFERAALAFVWIAPLAARQVAEATLVPLGFLAMATLYGLALRRAFGKRKAPDREPAFA